MSTLTVDLEESERHQYEEVAAESKACLPKEASSLERMALVLQAFGIKAAIVGGNTHV